MPINEAKTNKKGPFLFLVQLSGEEEVDNSLFSSKEIKAINFYKRKEDQLLKATSLLLVSLLIKKPVIRNKYGKPLAKDGPYFSLSHSYPYVVLVVGSSPIGVDVEITKLWDSRMDALCFVKEDKEIGLPPLRLWTLKEACYKSKGDYVFDPQKEKIKILSAKTLQDDNTIRYYLFLGDNNRELTVVSTNKLDELEISSLTYPELTKQRRLNHGRD
jgi:4'-phosphopantetheinyl transferase